MLNNPNLESTSLYQEIMKIGTGGSRTIYNISAELVNGTQVIDVFRVTTMTLFADYETDYTTEMLINLAMNRGVYNTVIQASPDNLTINLIITFCEENKDPEIKRMTLRAFPKSTGDERITQNHDSQLNQQAYASLEMGVYAFQLLDLAMEQMRMMQVGGVYPSTKPSAVLRVILGGMSGGVELPLEQKPLGLDVWEPDIDDPKGHVIVKQGIPLTDIAGYLQHHYGLYNTGIGYFYHNQYWHVWPLYNNKRFDLTDRTATVINVPRNKFPSMERTFEQRGNSIVILATGEVKMLDSTNRDQYNTGNGTRVAKSSGISGSSGLVTDKGKTLVSRGDTNMEFLTANRKTGVNMVPTMGEITDNVSRAVSRNAQTNGVYVQFTWENANPLALYPGMPVKFMYLKDAVVKTRYGSIVKAESSYQLANPGLADKAMLCNTAVTMFLTPDDDGDVTPM